MRCHRCNICCHRHAAKLFTATASDARTGPRSSAADAHPTTAATGTVVAPHLCARDKERSVSRTPTTSANENPSARSTFLRPGTATVCDIDHEQLVAHPRGDDTDDALVCHPIVPAVAVSRRSFHIHDDEVQHNDHIAASSTTNFETPETAITKKGSGWGAGAQIKRQGKWQKRERGSLMIAMMAASQGQSAVRHGKCEGVLIYFQKHSKNIPKKYF